MKTIGESSGDNLLLENSSASDIASNSDLLIEILLRLPVKTLFVFKSVSKEWLSLISDPHFTHNHCLRYRASVPGFFMCKTFDMNLNFEFISLDGNITTSASGSGPSFVPFRTPENMEVTVIRQSCNGLLCCTAIHRSESDNTLATSYYIYNPLTKHYKILPPSPVRKPGLSTSIWSVSLAFDPLKSPYYEAISVWSKDRVNYQFDIYSSKTASWRLSGYVFLPNLAKDTFSKSGVFWNGSLHWIGSREPFLYFDIHNEILKTMPMPPLPNGWDERRIEYFGVYKGHMHLIQMYGPRLSIQFDIFEMEPNYTRWNLKYRIDLNKLTPSPEMGWSEIYSVTSTFFNRSAFSILLVQEDDDDEEDKSLKLVLHISHRNVISCDLKDMSFTKIHNLMPRPYSELVQWSDAHQYIPTLACV